MLHSLGHEDKAAQLTSQAKQFRQEQQVIGEDIGEKNAGAYTDLRTRAEAVVPKMFEQSGRDRSLTAIDHWLKLCESEIRKLPTKSAGKFAVRRNELQTDRNNADDKTAQELSELEKSSRALLNSVINANYEGDRKSPKAK